MDQKHYLIIGGTSGIGKCLSAQLHAKGHRITVISRGNHAAESNDNQITSLQADVADSNEPLPLIQDPIHGLVYCPGTINLKPFRALKDEDFIHDFQVNLIGAVRTIRNYLPNLIAAAPASVVLFSTVAVGTGMGFHTSVAAAKGALEGFARSLAAEMAPKLRVNIIAPSLTNTPLAEKLLNSESKATASAERHPLRRIGTPEEVAETAAFLLSDSGSWITGQTLRIDGGMSSIR